MTLEKSQNRISLFAKHAVKYYLVGSIGVLVNLGLLYSLTEFFGLWYMASYGIAIISSITSNFVLNKLWTFRDSTTSQRNLMLYLKFVMVSLLGMGIQLGCAFLIVENLEIFYLQAAIISIALASGINFLINRRFTFGNKFRQISQ